MMNPPSSWRYHCGGRRESGRGRRVRRSNQREETAVHHHNPLRDEDGRVIHATGWVDTERLEGYAPEATAPSNQLVDIKETDVDCDGGWGIYPVDKNVSADVTGAWEALATANLSDWSKPPQIQSVEHWDDTGARDTWDFVIVGRSPQNNPDLYLEKNIDWNWRIPPELLTFVEYGCAAPPRPGNPVLLGLETLVQNRSGDIQPTPINDDMMNSKKNLQQGGGSLGSWEEKPQEAGGGSLGSWEEKPQEAGGGSLGSWGDIPQQGGGSLGSWEEKPQEAGGGSLGNWGKKPREPGGGSLGSWGENPQQQGGGSLGSWGENPQQQGGGSLGSWG